jgi:hypothetical protein
MARTILAAAIIFVLLSLGLTPAAAQYSAAPGAR